MSDVELLDEYHLEASAGEIGMSLRSGRLRFEVRDGDNGGWGAVELEEDEVRSLYRRVTALVVEVIESFDAPVENRDGVIQMHRVSDDDVDITLSMRKWDRRRDYVAVLSYEEALLVHAQLAALALNGNVDLRD